MSDKEEVYYFSKDKAPCKILKSNQYSDSSYTKYITDNLNLFRGIIVPIKRYTIKVKRGQLFVDSIKQVKIRVVGVSLILDNILYVSGLGINLFLS